MTKYLRQKKLREKTFIWAHSLSFQFIMAGRAWWSSSPNGSQEAEKQKMPVLIGI
jgi:hypothetical protein